MECPELLCIGTCIHIYKFEFIVCAVEVVDKQFISFTKKNFKKKYIYIVQFSAVQCSAAQWMVK